MGEWNRSTRESSLESLRPEIVGAINQHIELYNLGPILNDYLICVETRSTKKKKGLFSGGDGRPIIVTAITTPRWLVWVVEEKGVTALSVRLQDMVAVDYKDTPGYKLIPDSGIDITGTITGRIGVDDNQRTSSFIGLGEEPAAIKFKETLLRSVREAKLK